MYNTQQWVEVLRDKLGVTGYSILSNLRYADERILLDLLKELSKDIEDSTLGQAVVLASAFKRVRPRLYISDSNSDSD